MLRSNKIIYLKCETEMMTSRLRDAVSRETEKNIVCMSTASFQGGLLQEMLENCGKQSSFTTCISTFRELRAGLCSEQAWIYIADMF